MSASTDGVIPCGCHGSQFSIEDGSVVRGPATSPLSEIQITVDGDTISPA
ncbi:QcrA and Rieske domain-containing protein [Nocardioides sp. B-3]|nr:Rieske 2Fe-2S domain-containing protein [Nocardioides sp. B-3]UUZ59239.1 Rieske 2Fe-2S domain-containing protein [Nocardioides sp. B-3]